MKSVITHNSLGEITVSQSWRARRISIGVRPGGAVRLSLPYNVPLPDAMRFLDEKAEWIEATRQKLEDKYPRQIIEMPFETRWHSLRLFPSDVKRISVKLTESEIRVVYPAEQHYESEAVQTALKKGIEEAWRVEAKELLPARVAELARGFGLKYRSVSVRNTVSKWGSCSARCDLSLSIHLMRLPDHLIDYIITHELCHTVHHNHGPRFHALLDRLTGGRHEQLRREMKAQHTRW